MLPEFCLRIHFNVQTNPVPISCSNVRNCSTGRGATVPVLRPLPALAAAARHALTCASHHPTKSVPAHLRVRWCIRSLLHHSVFMHLTPKPLGRAPVSEFSLHFKLAQTVTLFEARRLSIIGHPVSLSKVSSTNQPEVILDVSNSASAASITDVVPSALEHELLKQTPTQANSYLLLQFCVHFSPL
jgi:hypothetical protein